MAAEILVNHKMMVGNVRAVFLEVVPDDSYPNPGGYEFTVAELTDNFIKTPIHVEHTAFKGGFHVGVTSEDNVTFAIQLYGGSATTAHTHTTPAITPTITVGAGTVTDPAGFTAGAVFAAGTGGTITANQVAAGVTGSATPAGGGASVEVANATDLSNVGAIGITIYGN